MKTKLFFLLLCSVFQLQLNAQTFTINDITYQISGSNVTISQYNGNTPTIIKSHNAYYSRKHNKYW